MPNPSSSNFRRSLKVVLSLVAAGLLSAAPDPLPVEAFFTEPDMTSVQVSPDGQTLAFLTTLGTGKVGIALMHLATGKVEPLVGAKDENIEFYFWKNSDWIVYGGDLGGNESASLRSISLSKRKVVALAESYRERYADRANQASIVDRLRFDPNRILILGNLGIGSFNFGLWLLDVRNGQRSAVASYDPKPDTQDLVADNNGVIRGRSYLLGEKVIFEVRPEPDSGFVKVAEFPVNRPQWAFMGFAADNESLYLATTDRTDTAALHAFNVRTRTLGPVLFHSPEGEMEALLRSWDYTKFYGVRYLTDKGRYYFADPARAALQQKIDASLPGTDNRVISSSQDEKILVIHASSDRDPGTVYLLNLRNPALMMVGKVNRRINPAEMQPMEPISFAARDGLTIHGYLTRPAGADGRPTPLIVNPHGGPFGIRDEWGFNAEVQLLANRGYAVLQINYRGSGGYGYSFLAAGQREWGGKMQDDLTDGVKWAIAQGYADPERVAIYGASYGGYAALAGVTFTPELYRCAVNYVGVSDLNLITSWAAAGRAGRANDIFFRQWVGDDNDYKFRRSPLNFVENIRVPTLHAYGYNDPRVDIKHWTRLEPKLKQLGKPYEVIIQGDEGHGFRNEGGRIEFYRKLVDFFDRNLARARLAPLDVLETPAKKKSD